MWIILRNSNECDNVCCTLLLLGRCLRPSYENIEVILDRVPIEREILRSKFDYCLLSAHNCTIHDSSWTYGYWKFAHACRDIKIALLSKIGVGRKQDCRGLSSHYHDPDCILKLNVKWVFVVAWPRTLKLTRLALLGGPTGSLEARAFAGWGLAHMYSWSVSIGGYEPVLNAVA